MQAGAHLVRVSPSSPLEELRVTMAGSKSTDTKSIHVQEVANLFFNLRKMIQDGLVCLV